MVIEKKIQEILSEENKEEKFIEFISELKKGGYSKSEIYSFFYSQQIKYEEMGDDESANILFDFLDMISGYYPGKNIEFKD